MYNGLSCEGSQILIMLDVASLHPHSSTVYLHPIFTTEGMPTYPGVHTLILTVDIY